jgi:hypothetical protein
MPIEPNAFQVGMQSVMEDTHVGEHQKTYGLYTLRPALEVELAPELKVEFLS